MEFSVNLEVDFPSVLSRSFFIQFLMDLLKYILYQRHQIPINFDTICQEIKKSEVLSSTKPMCHDNSDREVTYCSTSKEIKIKENFLNKNQPCFIKAILEPENITVALQQIYGDSALIKQLKHYLKKEEVMLRRMQKKKVEFIKKAKLFMKSFESATEILKNEMLNSEVVAVGFFVGLSMLTAQEAFYIHCPVLNSYDNNNSRKIYQEFLRALVLNEKLAKFISVPRLASKLWIAVKKKTDNKEFNYVPSNSESGFPQLLLRHNFTSSKRTKVVNLYCVQKVQSPKNMELTPCVGGMQNIEFLSTAKRKLIVDQSLNMSAKREDRTLDCLSLLNLSDYYQFNSYSHSQLEMTAYNSPVKQPFYIMGSPVSDMSQKLEFFELSTSKYKVADKLESFIWFQITTPILSFKNVKL